MVCGRPPLLSPGPGQTFAKLLRHGGFWSLPGSVGRMWDAENLFLALDRLATGEDGRKDTAGLVGRTWRAPGCVGETVFVEVLGASGHAQQSLAGASLAPSLLAITRRAGGPPFVRCLWGWGAHTAPEVRAWLAPLSLLPTSWHFEMPGLWQAGVPSGPQPITSFCF